jgi:hypothetical protein
MRNSCYHRRHSRIAALLARAGIVLFLGAYCVGCSSNKKTAEVVEANAYPPNYKDQIANFLMTVLSDSADFHNAMVSTPVLKSVGQNQHYVACVLLNGRNQHKEKAVIYFAGNINQFVDATPDECGGADYQPFPELAKVAPR